MGSEALIFETLNKGRDLYPFGFAGLLLVIDWTWPLKLAIHNSKFASIKTDELGINSSGEFYYNLFEYYQYERPSLKVLKQFHCLHCEITGV